MSVDASVEAILSELYGKTEEEHRGALTAQLHCFLALLCPGFGKSYLPQYV